MLNRLLYTQNKENSPTQIQHCSFGYTLFKSIEHQGSKRCANNWDDEYKSLLILQFSVSRFSTSSYRLKMLQLCSCVLFALANERVSSVCADFTSPLRGVPTGTLSR